MVKACSRIRHLVLLMVFAPLAMGQQIEIEEHWSPYQYPKTLPEGTKVHIIKDGDTLWDIAGTYLGDPLLWPQIYRVNDYIGDPDLIYPGDPLVLDVGFVVNDQSIEDQTQTQGDTMADSDQPLTVPDEFEEFSDAEEAEETVSDRTEATSFLDDTTEFVILPAGDRTDMDCSSYIYPLLSSKEVLPFDFQIMGAEDTDRFTFAIDHVVYMNKGAAQGVRPGDVYSVRRQLGKVYDPDNGNKLLGIGIDQLGILKILAVQDNNSTGIITDSCSEIVFGDFLVPYEQEPIPLITEFPQIDHYAGFTAPSGAIVMSEDNAIALGKGSVTSINLGVADNIAPGDLFAIFRKNPNNDLKAGLVLPEIFLGQGVALKTFEQTSVMKIISGKVDIQIGDRVLPLTL